MLTVAEKQIKDEFSQDWMVYRVVTHETKQCQLWELDSHITYVQLLNMLEICDTYDAISKVAQEKEAAKKAKQRQG